MDEQRYSQRVRTGLIVLGAIFVAPGFLPGVEFWSAVIGLVK